MISRTAEVGSGAGEESAITRVGPIAVRTDSATVQEFQRACGGEPVPGIVPLIFPIRWLALPEIRARILELAGGRNLVPIHESQSFTTTRRLALDRDYRLAMAIARTSQPERLTLQGTVTTPEGDVCIELETVLRLVGLADGGAGSPLRK